MKSHSIKSVAGKIVIAVLCAAMLLAFLLPREPLTAKAATTRYCDVKIDMGGKITQMRVRYGDHPQAWFVGNPLGGVIIGKSGVTTNNSDGVAPAGTMDNWKYVKVRLTIPVGYYFVPGTSSTNFESGDVSSVQFTKPVSGNSPTTNNGLPSSPSTESREWEFTMYWANNSNRPSTTSGRSYKTWPMTINHYTVNFFDGAGNVYNSQSIPYGSGAAAPANPSSHGYNFLGWNTDFSKVTSNLDVWPNWAPWQHTVAYNANGGWGEPGAQTKTYGSLLYLSPTVPTRTGHNFLYWTGDSGVGSYNPGAAYGYDFNGGTVTMYAQWAAWQHTVAYNANGGTGAPGNQTKTYGSALTLSNTRPTRAGYTFSHWAGDNGVGTFAPGASYGADFNGGTVTLSAQWTANKYTVSYNANGGSGSMASDTPTYDAAFSVKSNSFTKTGYEFAGWNDKADGTGNNWTGWSGTWRRTGDLNLYAQWKALNYTIKFDANGGTGSMGNQTATYDSALNLSANRFARPTYTFLGWSKDKDAATASYSNSQSVKNIGPGGGAITLYAVWRKTDASFDTSTLIHDENMFTGDGKIVGGAGTTYDKNNVDSKYAHVDNASNPGYFTRR